MKQKPTVTRAQARELKRIAERMAREGGGVSPEVIRREMLEDMASDLRAMVRAYDGSGRRARELIEAMAIAEQEGVSGLDEILRELGAKVRKRNAA